MYIYGKYSVQIDNSKIWIRRYIASNRVVINDSEIYINNATTANSMILADYNINLTNSKVTLQRGIENYAACCALYCVNGNLILNGSTLTIDLELLEGGRNIAMDLKNGYIETNNSTISVTNILHALHFKCFGRCIRSENKTLINIGLRNKKIENNYRFETNILDCKVMVYVVDETVKSAEFLETLDGSMDPYDFEEDYYWEQKYIT